MHKNYDTYKNRHLYWKHWNMKVTAIVIIVGIILNNLKKKLEEMKNQRENRFYKTVKIS